MASSYYSQNRDPAATLLQQRGQTAVLGTGHTATPSAASFATETASSSSHGGGSSTATAGLAAASARAGLAGTAAAARTPRSIGRRKLRRSENARLSSNPHVVRPSPRDYSLPHNTRQPSFPLPPELQQVFAASMRAERQGTAIGGGDASDNHQQGGPFTMGFSDAHWFLTHRCGVRPCGLEAIAPNLATEDSTMASSSTFSSLSGNAGLGAVQLFVKQAEAIMAAWLTQDVFLKPNAAHTDERSARRQALSSPALIDLRSLQTGASDERDLRLFEVTRNPHNLVWSIPDPFMRLAVHCLARVLSCPSFSKNGVVATDSDGGDRRSQPVPGRHTWILNGRAHAAPRAQASVGGSGGGVVRSSARPGAATATLPSDLETPPATDVGSEMASDVAASEIASEPDSDWVVSDLAEDEEAEEIEVVGADSEGAWDTTIDAASVRREDHDAVGGE